MVAQNKSLLYVGLLLLLFVSSIWLSEICVVFVLYFFIRNLLLPLFRWNKFIVNECLYWTSQNFSLIIWVILSEWKNNVRLMIPLFLSVIVWNSATRSGQDRFRDPAQFQRMISEQEGYDGTQPDAIVLAMDDLPHPVEQLYELHHLIVLH